MAAKKEAPPEETLPQTVPQTDLLPATAPTGSIPSGYDALDPSDFVIPRLKIVQPTSKEGTPGTLRMNLTGEEFTELRIIAIKVEPGRVYWDRDSDSDRPICRSFDGHVPDPRIEDPPSPRCMDVTVSKGGKQLMQAACEMAMWGDDRAKPPCDQIYNMLCISADDDLPLWMTIGGTSITSFKKFVSSIALRRRALSEYETVISLEECAGKKGKYYVLKFATPKIVQPDFREHVAELVNVFQNETTRRDYDTTTTADAENTVDTTGTDQPGETPSWMDE